MGTRGLIFIKRKNKIKLAQYCQFDMYYQGAWFKNKLKEIVHNNLVHGIISFLPRHISEKMHDKNAEWSFGKESAHKTP